LKAQTDGAYMGSHDVIFRRIIIYFKTVRIYGAIKVNQMKRIQIRNQYS
jgi:hypothetical protein